jgi:Ca2+-binding RTX toxin-like protein
LRGGNGNDLIFGGGGKDTLVGGAGGDSIYGGTGFDTADYATSAAAVQIDLGAGTFTGGEAQGDSLAEIEGLVGSAFGDTLTGHAGANTLQGGAGADTLNGGDGDDRLLGGNGVDTVRGGSGLDTFVLLPTQADRDIVNSFVHADDTLEVSAALFGGGLVAGALAPSQFVSNSTGLAGDANDRFIFNTGTGQLFFDDNGNAAGGSRLIATFTGTPPVLTATDFSLV